MTTTKVTYGVITREDQNKPEDHLYAGHATAQEAIASHRESCARMLRIIQHAKDNGYYDDSPDMAESERIYTSDAVDIVGIVQRTETIATEYTRLTLVDE